MNEYEFHDVDYDFMGEVAILIKNAGDDILDPENSYRKELIEKITSLDEQDFGRFLTIYNMGKDYFGTEYDDVKKKLPTMKELLVYEIIESDKALNNIFKGAKVMR